MKMHNWKIIANICYDILFSNSGDTGVLHGVWLSEDQPVPQNLFHKDHICGNLIQEIMFVKQVDEDGTANKVELGGDT